VPLEPSGTEICPYFFFANNDKLASSLSDSRVRIEMAHLKESDLNRPLSREIEGDHAHNCRDVNLNRRIYGHTKGSGQGRNRLWSR
jgi:hypothetical protein